MRVLVLLLAMSTFAHAASPTRAEFAAKLAKVKPGMTAAQVEKLLGKPDDIKTEADPGGIAAARTVEVWRYGARGHLAFGTLGTVHIQADKKVQYVFGAKGKPFTAMPEPELRKLLEALAAVPSYNASNYDPLPLIRAVNALQPLGKDKALAVIGEFLRVSSWLDDPGREGVFLVLRVLFDVPAGKMPMMAVGAPSPPPPNPAPPLYPLVLVGDVPFKLVSGYMLGGEAEPPEMDVEAFAKVGTMRKAPLVPTNVLDALDAFAAKLDESMRTFLYDQALRLYGTVERPAETIDGWFPAGKDTDARWKTARTRIAAIKPKWNATTQQLEKPDGTTLPAIVNTARRVWWDIGVAGTSKSRVTFERRSDKWVDVEVRLEVLANKAVKADKVRILDAKGKELAAIDIAAVSVVNSTSGSVSGRRLELPKGQSVQLELASGAHGPTLTP